MPAGGVYTYAKLDSIAIIADVADFIRTVPRMLLPRHEAEGFSLYNQAEHWHISCHTNSTGVRFKNKPH
jgi:hypothetical protein